MRPADTTIEHILNILNDIAPFRLAEEWDNVGLLIGAPGTPVTGILIGLDPTASLLDEATSLGANLVVTHHPLIFQAVKAVRTDQPAGALIAKAITAGIGIIACHTNLDVVTDGVSHALAHALGLAGLTPLTATPGAVDHGFGRIGTLAAPQSGHAFLAELCRVLAVPALAVAGPLPDSIQRVAVCGGSASELATQAQASGAEIFVTAEVKHHIARWAEEAGFCVVDGGHFATERLVCSPLAGRLAATLAGQEIPIPVHVTDRQKNPFSFYMQENDQQPSNERYGH